MFGNIALEITTDKEGRFVVSLIFFISCFEFIQFKMTTQQWTVTALQGDAAGQEGFALNFCSQFFM